MTTLNTANAACRNADPDLFFETDSFPVAQAKSYCHRCPIQVDCLDHALKYREAGTWGGTTEEERNRARRSPATLAMLRVRAGAQSASVDVPLNISAACPSTGTHGTAYAYRRHGCTCLAARVAAAASKRRQNANRKARGGAKGPSTQATAANLRAAILLLHEAGLSGPAIGRHLEIHPRTAQRHINRERKARAAALAAKAEVTPAEAAVA